ncbi:hypothetical protein V1509DRAFT_568033, partial [Lipomyces kononenkoae]
FTLIKENSPEQRLDVQLPYEKVLKLDAACSELRSKARISEEKRYPTSANNSLTDTVTAISARTNMREVAADLSIHQVHSQMSVFVSLDLRQSISAREAILGA